MEKKKQIGKRILSLFLAFAMLCTMQDMTAFAQAGVLAPQLESAEVAQGDVIYLGSYPQSEVVRPSAAITTAEYDGNGDAVVEGVKYRRVKGTVRVTWEEYLQYAQEHNITLPEKSQDIDTFAACEKEKTEKEGKWHYFRWEPIQWKVLANEGSTLFVRAVNILDAQDYYNYSKNDVNDASWTEATLRQWLNTEAAGFYQTAFTSDEKSAIVAAASNPEKDKVFLLSEGEIKNTSYGFENTDDASAGRVIQATAYAKEVGATIANPVNDYTCRYLLRTPASFPYIKTVTYDGKILSTRGTYEVPAYYRAQYEDQGYAYGRFFDGCLPAMRLDASSEHAQTLEGIKAKAIEELKAYDTGVEYGDLGKAQWEEEISAGTTNINNASDPEAVRKALAEAKAAVDKIKPEAEIVAIGNAKTEAIAKLDAYLTSESLAQYTSANQKTLKQYVEDSKNLIQDSASVEEVQNCLEQAEQWIEENIPKIKPADLTEPKAEAAAKLDAYLAQLDKYEKANQEALKTAVSDGKAAIEKAASVEEINRALSEAEAKIKDIPTKTDPGTTDPSGPSDPGTTNPAGPGQAEELEKAKADAKEQLAAYADELKKKNLYGSKALSQIALTVADGNTNIAMSTNKDDVEMFLNYFKERLAKITPDKTFEEVKQEAKEDLATYKSDKKEASGQESQWEKVIANAQTAIDSAEGREAIADLLKNAKAKIDKIVSGQIVTDEELELDQKRNEAVKELDNYFKEFKSDDYYSGEWMWMNQVVAQAKYDIYYTAADEQALASILENAKKELDKVSTKAEKDKKAEEAKKKLKEAIDAAVAELKGYLDKIGGYTALQQKDLKNLIEKGISSVERASIETLVKERLEEAKRNIEERMGQYDKLKPSVLSTAKKKAKAELEAYKDAKNYRTAQKKELQNAINAGKAAIDAAKSKEDVEKALQDAKAEIDKIKTDAQMKKEEENQVPTAPKKKIVPAKTSISGKIKAQKKGFTVKWKKQTKNVDGYEVCYSTNKKFPKKGSVTKKVKKKTTTKLTVKKLKAKKKYYVKVRTYKVVKGKKYVSSWSSVKTVVTKK